MNKKEIKKGRHSQESLLGISLLYVVNEIKKILHLINNRKAGDPRVLRTATSGMTASFNKAFTLIELLVVVLIIGILAAIALPQYSKAVEKSRAVQILAVGKALAEAEEAYYLANGSYTDVLENLDVDVTLPEGYSLTMRAAASSKLQFNRAGYEITFVLNHATMDAGTIYCFAGSGSSKQIIDFCKSWGGEDLTKGRDAHYRYRIN